MDLSGIEAFIPDIAAYFHVQPATLLLLIGIVCTGANIVSRLIPDDAVGFPGFVRKVCSVIGVYASNRVTSGISINDLGKKLVGSQVPLVTDIAIRNAAGDAAALIPEVVEDATDLVIPAFPGLQEKGE